MNLGQFWVLDF